ncbi:MAG: sulfur carrier protein ThiS [Planctomycetota bacterium]
MNDFRDSLSVVVNGQPRQIDPSMTITAVLKLCDVPPNYLAVEVNSDVVPREFHDSQTLNDGDVVEVVTLVGGG